MGGAIEIPSMAPPISLFALGELCPAGAWFATLAERKTCFYIAVKMTDQRAATMENAIVSALAVFPPQLIKSITGAQNLQTGARLRNSYTMTRILLIRIVLGRKVHMKI